MPILGSDWRGNRYGIDGLHYAEGPDGMALVVRPMSVWQAISLVFRPRVARPWVVTGPNEWRVWRDEKSLTGRYLLQLGGFLTQGEINEIGRVGAMYTEPMAFPAPPPASDD